MLSFRVFRHVVNCIIFHQPIRPLCLPRTSLASSRVRHGSSSSQWKARQNRDSFSREAKVKGLKSRAAFKLLEMNQKYKFFKRGQTVVDLGYAPGSWSQVAIDRVSPGGRVVGIDVIPTQPPRGVSTIQGNFLSPAIQAEVRAYVQDPNRGRLRRTLVASSESDEAEAEDEEELQLSTVEEIANSDRGYLELERHAPLESASDPSVSESDSTSEQEQALQQASEKDKRMSMKQKDEMNGRVVDVVLSDMSEPWEQTTGFWQKSLSNPYRRMMNTTGNSFKDHVGSMDLCMAGLSFCFSTLRTGGNFLCKFYDGAETKEFEKRIRALFEKVHREKPDASRKDSKEAYFVALRRKEDALEEEVLKPLG